MSRTFAHRPGRARFDDPSTCTPVHDHRRGPCDLPTLPEWRDWMNHGDKDQPCGAGGSCFGSVGRCCAGGGSARSPTQQVWLRPGAWPDEWADPPLVP